MNAITGKKLTVVTLTLVTASLALTGCGSKPEEKNTTPPSAGTSTNPEYRKKAGGS